MGDWTRAKNENHKSMEESQTHKISKTKSEFIAHSTRSHQMIIINSNKSHFNCEDAESVMKNIFYDLIVCWKSWENKKPYESSSEGMRESRAVLMEIYKKN